MGKDATDEQARRAATRLAAVQAVYEMAAVDAPSDAVLAEFQANRWLNADDENDLELAKPRPQLLSDLVQGVGAHFGDINTALERALTQQRALEGIEAVLLAILRVGCCEFLVRPNVPARTIIVAYTEVCDSFFEDGPQTKLAAGALNALARDLRADEFL